MSLCKERRNGRRCIIREGHEGRHRDDDGNTWPADSVCPLHPDAQRILKTLIQRVGGSVILTEHDRQRADRFQLRYTDNGHTLEIKAVDDT